MQEGSLSPHPASIDLVVGLLVVAILFEASLIAQLVKDLPAMQETLVRFLGQENPPKKGQATHSSILGLPLWLSW